MQPVRGHHQQTTRSNLNNPSPTATVFSPADNKSHARGLLYKTDFLKKRKEKAYDKVKTGLIASTKSKNERFLVQSFSDNNRRLLATTTVHWHAA